MAVMIRVDELVRLAILNDTAEAWNDLRERRTEILKLLDDGELKLSTEEQRALDSHPETLVKLLGALGDDLDGLNPEERESVEALVRAQDRDEELVGSAFMHVLLPGLSPKLLQFDRWFGDLPTVDNAEREELRSRPDVSAANKDGRYPEVLLRHGVTPLTLLYATQSPWNVYDDLRRSHEIEGDRVIMTSADSNEATVPAGSVVREIGLLIECERSLAMALYNFCFAAAFDRHAYFWEGFEAKPEGKSTLSLRPVERKAIEECWQTTR